MEIKTVKIQMLPKVGKNRLMLTLDNVSSVYARDTITLAFYFPLTSTRNYIESSLLFLSATLKLIRSSISTMLKKLETSLSTNHSFTSKISLSVLLNTNYYILIALQLLKNIDGTTNNQSAITL
jgi:hypothetical protein